MLSVTPTRPQLGPAPDLRAGRAHYAKVPRIHNVHTLLHSGIPPTRNHAWKKGGCEEKGEWVSRWAIRGPNTSGEGGRCLSSAWFSTCGAVWASACLRPSPGRMSFAYPSMQMQADSAPGSSHGHPRVR